MELTLSYCVVNTNGRKYLPACLDAIATTHPADTSAEILVLDNASSDGSVDAVREWDAARGEEQSRELPLRLIALERAQGKAANDSRLMAESRGRYCLLLNEDSELLDGATAALLAALEADPDAAAAGPQLLDSDLSPTPCAWRFPGVRTALVGALFMHRRLTVQSGGSGPPRPVDWAQSSALLVRRDAAEAIDYLDADFFVYYDECDFCKRLAEAGRRTLYVPAARAIHHDQLSTDLSGSLPRIVEFHRNRDLYMRKHHGPAGAFAVRLLTAWTYALRALAALGLPRHPQRIYLAHARQALRPYIGEGIRNRVEAGR